MRFLVGLLVAANLSGGVVFVVSHQPPVEPVRVMVWPKQFVHLRPFSGQLRVVAP